MIQAQLQAHQRQEPSAQTQDAGADDLQPTGQPQASVQRFGHVPVYGYERAKPKGGQEDAEGVEWMVMFNERWSTNRLKEFCLRNISAPAHCVYVGNPNQGGLHYLTIKGYEPEVRACVSSFSAEDGPRFVELDGPMYLLPYEHGDTVRTSSASSVPWGLDRIDNGKEGLDGQYTQGEGGRGVHVYHFDTGVQPAHPDFGGRVVPTFDVGLTSTFNSARGCAAAETCAFDRQGHGTHTAGTIAGREFGVAKQATVHACKILNDHGYGSWSSFVHAIDWVMSNGERPAVVSASLGGSGKMRMVKEAIDRAVANDITVVVAAGNDATDTCDFTPAYVRSAITVGATDYFDTMAPYNNWGGCLDIFAPGTDIVSIDINKGGSVAMSGTSMSAPHVAGVAALILGENPTLTPAKVQARIVMGSTRGAVNGITRPSTRNRLLYVSQGVIGKPGEPTPAYWEDDEPAPDEEEEEEEAPTWDLAADNEAQPDMALLPLPQKLGSEEWAAPALDETLLPVSPEAAPAFEAPFPMTPEAAPGLETPFPVN